MWNFYQYCRPNIDAYYTDRPGLLPMLFIPLVHTHPCTVRLTFGTLESLNCVLYIDGRCVKTVRRPYNIQSGIKKENRYFWCVVPIFGTMDRFLNKTTHCSLLFPFQNHRHQIINIDMSTETWFSFRFITNLQWCVFHPYIRHHQPWEHQV